MARVAGRETERAQALAKECIPSIIPGPGWGVDVSTVELGGWDRQGHTRWDAAIPIAKGLPCFALNTAEYLGALQG